jgi:hypothetical protein
MGRNTAAIDIRSLANCEVKDLWSLEHWEVSIFPISKCLGYKLNNRSSIRICGELHEMKKESQNFQTEI